MKTAALIALLAWPLATQAAAQPPAAQAPAQVALRAQYDWGYAGADGEGKGTLSVLVEPASGKVVMELHGAGERLMLLQGDTASGYHLLIPRRDLDQRASSIAGLNLPFLPSLGSAEALHRLLAKGEGPGVTVTKRDADGPRNLHYKGKDEHGKDVQVWMHRTRLETQP